MMDSVKTGLSAIAIGGLTLVSLAGWEVARFYRLTVRSVPREWDEPFDIG